MPNGRPSLQQAPPPARPDPRVTLLRNRGAALRQAGRLTGPQLDVLDRGITAQAVPLMRAAATLSEQAVDDALIHFAFQS